MNLVLGVLSTLLTVTTPYDGIWNVGTSIPRGLCSSAIGYHNNSIFLIGGEKRGSQRSVLEYKVARNNFTDYGEFYLPQINAFYNTRIESQHYTQIDHYLYIIDSSSLFRFDLKNKSHDSDWNGVTLPYESSTGCLASFDDLLFIIGGRYSGSVHALNLSTSSWLAANISSTIMGRDQFSCVVHPLRKRLYAIGGFRMGSIESLYIGDDQDISTQTWQYLNGSLDDIGLYGVFTVGKRSTVYGDDIWSFGGFLYRYWSYNDRVSYTFEDEIAIIDTLSGAVTSGGSVGYSAFGVAPIAVNDFMYLFGGCTSWISDDTRSRSSDDEFRTTGATRIADLLATGAPTETPTTAAPTMVTESPTDYPTAAPTTAAPTELPTTAAPTTGAPTQSPTTAAPTAETDTPTTSAPTPETNAPTTAPPTTAAPSDSPTTGAPTTGAPSETTGAPTATPTTMMSTGSSVTVMKESESYDDASKGSRLSTKGKMSILLCIGTVILNFRVF